MNLKELNTRQLQVYGAICLWKFCDIFNIHHKDIDILIKHLMSICIVDDLSTWEENGTIINITGRGDALPNDIVSIIPKNLLKGFTRLIEYSIEIGIVDMYGDNTELPLIFLKKCTDILSEHNIMTPDISVQFKYNHPSGRVWGDTISKES